MIGAHVDMKKLESDLKWMAAQFGECNETGIARWGVATCRRLAKETQVWGDGKEARIKQEKAIEKDAHRVAIVVSKPKFTKLIRAKKMTGITVNGVTYLFRPHQNITTEQHLNEWMELNRTGRDARPPKRGLPPGMMCVTTQQVYNAAMRKRKKRAGKAKGGWIGAGKGIGRFQRTGSRITIGKNVASYAHKWDMGGHASMVKAIWTPAGTMVNTYRHAGNDLVLRESQITESIADAAKNMITWYEKAMNGRLRNRKAA